MAQEKQWQYRAKGYIFYVDLYGGADGWRWVAYAQSDEDRRANRENLVEVGQGTEPFSSDTNAVLDAQQQLDRWAHEHEQKGR